jgi:hypothetical protein
MKRFVFSLLVILSSQEVLGQGCDLDSLMGDKSEMGIVGVDTSPGRRLDIRDGNEWVSKIGTVELSNTSFLFKVGVCEFYLPIKQGVIGTIVDEDYLLIISFEKLKNGERVYYIKEIIEITSEGHLGVEE